MTSRPIAVAPPGARPGPRVLSGRAGVRPGGAAATAVAESRLPWNLLMLTVSGAILSYVWRIQDLYGILASLQYPSLISLAAGGAYFINQDPRGKLGGFRHPVLKWATVIGALVVLSGPFSIARGMTFWFVVSDFSKTFLLMLLIAASIRGFRDVERYAMVVVIGGFIFAFYTYTHFSVGIGGRLGGLVFYDANDLGALLVFTLPLALYFAVRGRAVWGRWAALGCLGLFIIVLIQTGSRGAFLGMIAVALYVLFGFGAIAKSKRILAIAAGVTVMMVFASDEYWGMMKTLLNPTSDYNWSTEVEAGRRQVWTRGLGYMLSNPVVGLGAATFEHAEGTISNIAHLQEMGIGVKWSSAHNSFVELGAEIGVIGFVAYLLVLWHSFQAARNTVPARPGARLSDESVLGQAMAGSVIGYIVAGSFVSHAFLSYPFVLYGMIIGFAKTTGAARRPPPPR